MRDVREPGDHDQCQQRIEIPRYETEDVLRQCRENSDRADRHDVTECNHHGRHENRDQDQRFEISPAWNVGAHHQECEQGTKRHRDRGHAGCDRDSRPERLPEIRIGQDERIGEQPDFCRRIEKRGGEEALIDHKRERRHHGQRGDAEHKQSIRDNGHGCPWSGAPAGAL
jgi:hypothetical protein